MIDTQLIRGPILNPRDDGTVDFIADGALLSDSGGRIASVGAWQQIAPRVATHVFMRHSDGIICPPFLDAHIHIPQHPIRGRFLEGIEPNPEGGRLLAGLHRNVFPAEARCADPEHTERVIRQFLDDTLAHGGVGGSAYMTVHYPATVRALEILPETWLVGLVLMNQNCPDYLRIDEANIERHLTELAERFGRRVVLTDRFAVAVDSSLRRRAMKIAARFGLMSQTHLNEQIHEKRLVEQTLYPDAESYAHVYVRDGLLDVPSILAHCIHTRDEELDLIRRCGAMIAHCPTSNTLLGSGIMPLDRIRQHGIEYAICTDVGASPTTSLLAEMAQYLKVHAGRSRRATPSEALFRATLVPARILGLHDRIGSFAPGRQFSFVEVCEWPADGAIDVDDVILRRLLGFSDHDLTRHVGLFAELERIASGGNPGLDVLADDVAKTAARLEDRVNRVTLAGMIAWERPRQGRI